MDKVLNGNWEAWIAISDYTAWIDTTKYVDYSINYDIEYEIKNLPDVSLMNDLEYFQHNLRKSCAIPSWYHMKSEILNLHQNLNLKLQSNNLP